MVVGYMIVASFVAMVAAILSALGGGSLLEIAGSYFGTGLAAVALLVLRVLLCDLLRPAHPAPSIPDPVLVPSRSNLKG